MKKILLLTVFCLIGLFTAHAQRFALIDMENAIKKALGGVDKISSHFEKNGSSFRLSVATEKSCELEGAYAFFYEYRTTYFNLNLTRENAIVLIDKAEELTKAL